MYTGSLAEVFNYDTGENPLGFWQPAQVLELQHGGHVVTPAGQRRVPGSLGAEAGLVDILASL